MNIHVHIDRLILDGLPIERSQGPLVQAAVEGEIARLLTAGGLSHELRHGVTVPRARAEDLTLGGEPQPVDLGRRIAQSVFTGIGRSE